MTQEKVYKKLREQYLEDYNGHFRDMYVGHNHAKRMATRYAIRNTLYTWRKQYERI